MSRLQRLVHSLIQVLVDYNEAKTRSPKVMEQYLKMSHEELMGALDHMIIEATTNSSRGSLLKYFRFVINELKPLIDKIEPLEEKEEDLIKDNLVAIMANCMNLLDLSQSNSITVFFDDRTAELYGFRRSLYFGATAPCESGQVIEKVLLKPFGFSGKESPEKIRAVISLMIDEHKEGLLPVQQMAKQIKVLTSENELLRHKIDSAKEKDTNIIEAMENLTRDHAELRINFDKLSVKNRLLNEEMEELRVKYSNLQNNPPAVPDNSNPYRRAKASVMMASPAARYSGLAGLSFLESFHKEEGPATEKPTSMFPGQV